MTHNTLEQLYRNGDATLAVNRINHREYIVNGIRYFCAWDSCKRKIDIGKQFGYKVIGWVVYKQQKII